MTLEKLFGQQVDVDIMRTQMEALMSAEGLPYGYRSHTYNTRRAQQLEEMPFMAHYTEPISSTASIWEISTSC